ncbi:salicylate hydroxylase [Actinoplanes octamycinicus]|uniref:Salicylate hydroxylase n=1 Tax=Actinoplanes octamycinicus TaxID=135948 RepID=A0A7W7M7A5_9ACTN|nr:FAD-dependent monooxygenase [Actinoplanes octamycinicus]MBB4739546.1 salicylate hydroxylase [Actinoplanes octamycinicus]
MRVDVIGAGIGGLSAALSLLSAGFDVHVHERAAALSETGAGIQISPNASRVLHGLGLAGALAGPAVRPLAFHQRRWQDGRTLQRAPLGEPIEARFGFPYYHLHRADLLAVLAAAIPAERIHLGRRLTGITEERDRVRARFADGSVTESEVLVGADGIHSRVRAELFGAEDARFTGCVAYRGLVPADRVSDLGIEVTTQVWLGPGRHFVHYFVSGQRMLNFVAVIERDAWTHESWTDRGDPADVLAAYRGWHPQVREIVEAADETYIWALFDRAPLARWSRGRVTLLGDACHAMLPFMAQGAAQAVEDGATLAGCLAAGRADPAGALLRYQDLRRERTARVQAMSAANKTRFHLPDGPAQRDRDAQLAAGSTGWSFDAMAWLYEHRA